MRQKQESPQAGPKRRRLPRLRIPTSGDTVSDDQRRLLKRVNTWAVVMDSNYRIPFTKIKFGVDPLLGLLPIYGDLAGLILGLYVLFLAWRLRVPPRLLLRMLSNAGVELVIGVIPLLGNAFDVYWRANSRNVRLLQHHFVPDEVSAQQRARWPLLYAGMLAGLFVLGLALTLFAWQSGWISTVWTSMTDITLQLWQALP